MNKYLIVLFLNLISIASISQTNNNPGADYIAEDNILVKMPDGGNLCLNVIRKKDGTKQPCIVWYDIYSDSSTEKNEGGKIIASMLDYCFITVNTRGKKCSTDEINPFERDAEDAYNIIDWISKQPWCNGKIGMVGGSYLGFSQWAATKHLHPCLKTIVPQVSVGAGIDYPMQNGVFMSYMLRWIHFVTNNKFTDMEYFQDSASWNKTVLNWYKGGYPFKSLDSVEGKANPIFRRWLSHPTYDEYWKKMTPQQNEFSKIKIPVLTITGYWDDDQLGAMYYYKQFQKYNPKGEQYLLMGPYDHYSSQGYVRDTIMGVVTDSAAKEYGSGLLFKWFDYVLKDSSKPELLKDKVNFEMTGENKWYHVSSLDKISNKTLTYYLDNGTLNKIKPDKNKTHQLKVDLKNRDFIKPWGEDIIAFPSIVIDSITKSPDMFYYYTPAFENDFRLSGDYTANLKFMINKKDVDFVMNLYEQTSEGKIICLNETMQRASLVEDRSVKHLLEPGKIQNINIINTFLTCKKINKGSRLIFAIGINKSPNWEINYGTGGDVSSESIKDAKEPVVIKWFNESSVTFKTYLEPGSDR